MEAMMTFSAVTTTDTNTLLNTYREKGTHRFADSWKSLP